MIEYECQYCDETSKSRSSLDVHRRAEHSDQADPDYVMLECPQCGDEYYAMESTADSRKYCSQQCANDARNDRRGNPPKAEYGDNWEERRRAARLRDDRLCAYCGSEQNDPAHDVHHIVECGFFNDDDVRNDLRNLITLCPDCHGTWESATDEEQLEMLNDVLERQKADRLAWVRAQQERLKD